MPGSTALPAMPFRGDPPSRKDWVLGQAFPFKPHHWSTRLGPDIPLPAEFSDLPHQGAFRIVDRATVHAIGSRVEDPVSAAQAYVAAAAWGSGKHPARPRRVFTGDTGQAMKVAETLHAAHLLLISDGPLPAYKAMDRGGSLNVKYLRAAFGTKFFHFSAYNRTDMPGPRPLILDQFVAVALNKALGWSWPTFGWTGSQYEHYLRLAESWATEWGCEADVIERVLFSLGKDLPLGRAALTGEAASLAKDPPTTRAT